MGEALGVEDGPAGGCGWAMDADAAMDAMDGRQWPLERRGSLQPAHSAHSGLDNVAPSADGLGDNDAVGHVAHSAHSPCCWPNRTGWSSTFLH